jgi:hypothetical protein
MIVIVSRRKTEMKMPRQDRSGDGRAHALFY